MLSCGNKSWGDNRTMKNETSIEGGNEEPPIANYIVNIFEDSKGNLWFGTMGKGAIKYDGDTLIYYTTADGLPINAIVNYAEDPAGNIWMGTQDGLVKYDGNTFQTFTEADGLAHFRVSQLQFDSKGNLWIGTWGGVNYYDGETFHKFEMPIPDVEVEDYQSTMDWVTTIMEDSKGNIWISRDGYGAMKFDGRGFSFITEKDGLLSDNVQSIIEDKNGSFWIGSRITERDHPDVKMRKGKGGVVKMVNGEIIHFDDVPGLSSSDNYELYEDSKGNIWIGLSGLGVYKYDGVKFTLYDKTDRMDLTYSMGVQAFLEDKKGNMWIGMSGGLYKMTEEGIKHFSQSKF